MQEAQDCDCRIRQKDNKVIRDGRGKNKKVEQTKNTFSNVPYLNPKRKSFYIQAEEVLGGKTSSLKCYYFPIMKLREG